MKNSNVGWIGAVPAHWTRASIGSIATPKSLTGGPNRELLSVYLKRGVVKFSDVDEKRTNATSEDLSKYQSVEPGDFVLNNQQAWRGSVGVSKYSGIISPAYIVCSLSNKLNSDYANLLFRDSSMVNQYVVCSKGVGTIQRNLYWPYLKRTWLFQPPLDEQAVIVKYLDYMDQRIKKLIAAKKKLIGLLEEQKQAIIHQAVTKGLDPNVPMKDSGIEWLGEVPMHWEVKRLKWVTRLQRGYDLPADKRINGPFPVISSGGEIGTHAEGKAPAPGVVMGRYGSTDAVFYVEQDFWPHNTALFVTDFQGNLPQLCYHLLCSISKADHAGKSAVPGVDRKDLYQIMVANPPIDEQLEIVKFIEQTTMDIKAVVNRIKLEIILQEEYHTRLFSDVVTGKMDVRDAAATLPDKDNYVETDLPKEVDEEDIDDNMDGVDSQ